jgi:Tfp pilus assembly protein PilF
MSSRRTRFVRSLHFAPVLLVAVCAATALPPNLGQAIEAQQALAAARPADAAIEVDLGNLLRFAERDAEAEAAYRRALELDPQSVAAHFNLGLLLQEQGKRRAALREFRAVVALDPRHAWAHYQAGVILDGWRLDELAVRAYARALALDPRLRFPDVNPHTIDNRLLTEAMLRGYRDYRPEAGPPMAFAQPRRITALLLGPAEEAAAAAAPAPSPVPAKPQVARPDAEAPPAPDAERQPSGGKFSRVLDRSDLRAGTSVGQATPPVGAGASRFADPRARGAVVGPSGRTITPFTPPAGQAPAQYYPGVPSSGRLDLKLFESERPTATAAVGMAPDVSPDA